MPQPTQQQLDEPRAPAEPAPALAGRRGQGGGSTAPPTAPAEARCRVWTFGMLRPPRRSRRLTAASPVTWRLTSSGVGPWAKAALVSLGARQLQGLQPTPGWAALIGGPLGLKPLQGGG